MGGRAFESFDTITTPRKTCFPPNKNYYYVNSVLLHNSCSHYNRAPHKQLSSLRKVHPPILLPAIHIGISGVDAAARLRLQALHRSLQINPGARQQTNLIHSSVFTHSQVTIQWAAFHSMPGRPTINIYTQTGPSTLTRPYISFIHSSPPPWDSSPAPPFAVNQHSQINLISFLPPKLSLRGTGSVSLLSRKVSEFAQEGWQIKISWESAQHKLMLYPTGGNSFFGVHCSHWDWFDLGIYAGHLTRQRDRGSSETLFGYLDPVLGRI